MKKKNEILNLWLQHWARLEREHNGGDNHNDDGDNHNDDGDGNPHDDRDIDDDNKKKDG